ncbi:MAG: TRAP transporter small permease [Pseudomonadota bacterium]|nr:TRAP transporter small permease [Pseudomonadota bacterium]
MRTIEKIASSISGAVGLIGGAIMLLMMTQVALDVLMKHFFNWPIPTTLETVASYYMVALVFLPLGVVTRDNEHLEVEMFTQKLAPRALSVVKLFGCVIGILYVGTMLDSSIDKAITMTRRGEEWETATVHMQVWPARWFLPLGATLMLVWLALQALDNLSFAVRGVRLISEPKPHEPTEDHAA